MKEEIRATLIQTTVSDIEENEDRITFYLENQYGACYAVEIEGKCKAVRLLGGEE